MFKNWNPNFGIILIKAWVQCTDYFKCRKLANREYSHSNFLSPFITINTDASWINPSQYYGLGFIINLDSKIVLLARSLGTLHDSPIQAKMVAISLALKHCKLNNWKPDKILCNSLRVVPVVTSFDDCVAWRLRDQIQNPHQSLKLFPNIVLEHINTEDNYIIDALAHHGVQNPQLSL